MRFPYLLQPVLAHLVSWPAAAQRCGRTTYNCRQKTFLTEGKMVVVGTLGLALIALGFIVFLFLGKRRVGLWMAAAGFVLHALYLVGRM